MGPIKTHEKPTNHDPCFLRSLKHGTGPHRSHRVHSHNVNAARHVTPRQTSTNKSDLLPEVNRAIPPNPGITGSSPSTDLLAPVLFLCGEDFPTSPGGSRSLISLDLLAGTLGGEAPLCGAWAPLASGSLQPPPVLKMALKLAKNPGFLTWTGLSLTELVRPDFCLCIRRLRSRLDRTLPMQDTFGEEGSDNEGSDFNRDPIRFGIIIVLAILQFLRLFTSLKYAFCGFGNLMIDVLDLRETRWELDLGIELGFELGFEMGAEEEFPFCDSLRSKKAFSLNHSSCASLDKE